MNWTTKDSHDCIEIMFGNYMVFQKESLQIEEPNSRLDSGKSFLNLSVVKQHSLVHSTPKLMDKRKELIKMWNPTYDYM